MESRHAPEPGKSAVAVAERLVSSRGAALWCLGVPVEFRSPEVAAAVLSAVRLYLEQVEEQAEAVEPNLSEAELNQ